MTRAQLLDRAAFAGYFVVIGLLGRLSVLPGTDLALFWPAAGIAVAWCAVTGWSRWLALDLALLAVLAYGVNTATGVEPSLAMGLSLAILVQALAFGVLISRWCPAWWGFGDEPPAGVDALRDFGFLLAAGFGSALVSALLGPASVVSISGADVSAVVSWVLRNGIGVVAIFPLSLYARHLMRARNPERGPAAVGPLRGRGPTEFVLLAIFTIASGSYVFVLNDSLPVPFLVLASSVWAGTRFASGIADGHAIVLSGFVVAATVLERGPFQAIGSAEDRVLVVQAYVVMIVVLTLALSVGRRESLTLADRVTRSERAATEQAAMVRTIVDSMSDGVSVIDSHGNLVLRNPASQQLVGETKRDADGLIDVHAYGLRHTDGRPIGPEESPMVLALSGATIEKEELLLRSPAAPDGRLLEVTARPLPGSDPPLVVLVFHDITAERRERDELASFAGVVAHDLLNPLTVVDGWTEALLEGMRAGDPIEPAVGIDQLERVQRAAHRMQHLISDLLAFTTARDRTINPVRVDLEAVVRDVARARIDASRVSDAVEPSIELDGPLPDVLAEPVLLRQVVDNIVGNAVKYVAPGVRPEVSVRAQLDGAGDAPGAMVLIEISDNGIGVPAGQHAQVFDSFHRAHADGGYRGTGLGLSIVKRIVERHGGTAIARDNDSGSGTTMSVSFPAAD